MKLTSRKQTTLNDRCTMIKMAYTQDAIGNDKPQETKNEVFCGLFSITENEHYKAAQAGLRADLGVIISDFDDNGAETVEINRKCYAAFFRYVRGDRKRYTIYRRYVRGDGYTELYLREAQGNE